MIIAKLKKNIDLVAVIEKAGVELQRYAGHARGLCPFHAEKTPSFFVFQDNRFKCFGCQESGDVIDFVQKLHGLSFPNALRHLGIEQGEITPKVRQEIERRKRRAELIKQFRDWEQRYCRNISESWRETKQQLNGIAPADLDLYAPLFHMLPVWEYHRDILINGNDKLKFKIYEEAQQCKNKILT